MSEPFPKLCRECKYAFMPDSDHMYRCSHPKVNAADGWALAAPERWAGVSCHAERNRAGWLAKCGMKGKLWDQR